MGLGQWVVRKGLASRRSPSSVVVVPGLARWPQTLKRTKGQDLQRTGDSAVVETSR
jgi:hypothetical protein